MKYKFFNRIRKLIFDDSNSIEIIDVNGVNEEELDVVDVIVVRCVANGRAKDVIRVYVK